jgi:heterodisulfide reductase subunit C
MATAAFDTPKLKSYPVIPLVQVGAMSHLKPFVASPRRSRRQLGFPGELVDDWQAKAIAKMGELLGKYRSLQVYMDACVHCGACSDKCHYFLGTGDPKNMPVARQDLMRKVYRRYFTFAGKHFPKLVGAVDLTREVLDEWFSYFNQCSECRRCSVFCPYGIDTAEVTMAAREIMASSEWARSTQRDHRQGAPHRQQPGHTRPGAGEHTAKAWKKTPRTTPAWTSSSRWTSRAPRYC